MKLQRSLLGAEQRQDGGGAGGHVTPTESTNSATAGLGEVCVDFAFSCFT